MIQLITYNNLNKHADQIVHFTSTKVGGVSDGAYSSLNLGLYTNDNPKNVEQNRLRLCTALNIMPERLLSAHQTHGTSIKSIDKEFLSLSPNQQKENLYGYDAFVCNIPDICITVTTADCVPVLLYDVKNKAVAAIHSGWRSTLYNICAKTIEQMRQQFGTQPTDIIATVGACISKDVYEVGEELHAEFWSKSFDTQQLFSNHTKGKYLFDIRKAVYLQLQAAGVANIEVSADCTFSQDDLFFSARKSGNHSGRMLSGIMIKST